MLGPINNFTSLVLKQHKNYSCRKQSLKDASSVKI